MTLYFTDYVFRIGASGWAVHVPWTLPSCSPPFTMSAMLKSTRMLPSARIAPRVYGIRAYSAPPPPPPNKPQGTPLEQTAKTDKAGTSGPIITVTLVGLLVGGLYMFSDDLKSYLSGGMAAADKSVVAEQKDGKMVSLFGGKKE